MTKKRLPKMGRSIMLWLIINNRFSPYDDKNPLAALKAYKGMVIIFLNRNLLLHHIF